jgi:hypothetical protein
MLPHDKIIEIFCIADDFCKEFSKELKKQLELPQGGQICSYRLHRKCVINITYFSVCVSVPYLCGERISSASRFCKMLI